MALCSCLPSFPLGLSFLLRGRSGIYIPARRWCKQDPLPQVSSLTEEERWVGEGNDQVSAAPISPDLGPASTHRRCSRAPTGRGGTRWTFLRVRLFALSPAQGVGGSVGGPGHRGTTAPAENLIEGREKWGARAPCKRSGLQAPQLWS